MQEYRGAVLDVPLWIEIRVAPGGRALDAWTAWEHDLDPRVRMVRVALDGFDLDEAEPLLRQVTADGRELEVVVHAGEPRPDALGALQKLTNVAGLYAWGLDDEQTVRPYLRLAAQMAVPSYVLAPMREDTLGSAERVAAMAEPTCRKAVFQAICGTAPEASLEGWAERVRVLRSEGYRVALEGCLPRGLGLDGRGCPGAVVSLLVEADGTVRPCAGGPALGSDLVAAWRSAEAEAWRRRNGAPDGLEVEGWGAISAQARPRLWCRREAHAGGVLLYDARDFRRFAVLPSADGPLLDAMEDGRSRAAIEEAGGRALLQRLYAERFITFR